MGFRDPIVDNWREDDDSVVLVETGQNVGIGTDTPDDSAVLDLTSTTQGFLLPRMTTVQRDAIGTPATLLLIWNTTDEEFQFWDGNSWESLSGGGSGSLVGTYARDFLLMGG